MIRCFFTFVAIFCATAARADEKSTDILRKLEREVASWGDYRVDFSITADGQKVEGSYWVDGDKYAVRTPLVEVYSDGTTRWEVDLGEKTVVVDAVDPTDRNPMANPTRLFDFLDDSHTHRFVGSAVIDGQRCDRLEITDGTDIVDAYISASDRPVRLVYSTSYLDEAIVIDISQIAAHAAFPVPKLDYPGFEVIDFR